MWNGGGNHWGKAGIHLVWCSTLILLCSLSQWRCVFCFYQVRRKRAFGFTFSWDVANRDQHLRFFLHLPMITVYFDYRTFPADLFRKTAHPQKAPEIGFWHLPPQDGISYRKETYYHHFQRNQNGPTGQEHHDGSLTINNTRLGICVLPSAPAVNHSDARGVHTEASFARVPTMDHFEFRETQQNCLSWKVLKRVQFLVMQVFDYQELFYGPFLGAEESFMSKDTVCPMQKDRKSVV